MWFELILFFYFESITRSFSYVLHVLTLLRSGISSLSKPTSSATFKNSETRSILVINFLYMSSPSLQFFLFMSKYFSIKKIVGLTLHLINSSQGYSGTCSWLTCADFIQIPCHQIGTFCFTLQVTKGTQLGCEEQLFSCTSMLLKYRVCTDF